MRFPLLSLKKMDPSMLLFELNNVTSRMSEDDARMVTSAAELASYLHRDQRRYVRDDMPAVPYIEHPLRNALRIARWGSRDAELLTIALLHDVVEDCAPELIEIEGITVAPNATKRVVQDHAISVLNSYYSPRVGESVAKLTNGFHNPKAKYLDHVKTMSSDRNFLLVKASDLHDNAGSLKHQVNGMDASKITKRIDKYTPAVEVVLDALQARSMDDMVANNACIAMGKLAHTLETLNAQFESTEHKTLFNKKNTSAFVERSL